MDGKLVLELSEAFSHQDVVRHQVEKLKHCNHPLVDFYIT